MRKLQLRNNPFVRTSVSSHFNLFLCKVPINFTRFFFSFFFVCVCVCLCLITLIGLRAMVMACHPSQLQSMFICLFSSSKSHFSHILLWPPFANDLYYAFALPRATTFCFLLPHTTKFPTEKCNSIILIFNLWLSLPNLHLYLPQCSVFILLIE